MWQKGNRNGVVVYDRGDVCLPTPADQSNPNPSQVTKSPVLVPIVEETASAMATLNSPLNSINRIPASGSDSLEVMKLLDLTETHPDVSAPAPAVPTTISVYKPHQVYFISGKEDMCKVTQIIYNIIYICIYILCTPLCCIGSNRIIKISIPIREKC